MLRNPTAVPKAEDGLGCTVQTLRDSTNPAQTGNFCLSVLHLSHSSNVSSGGFFLLKYLIQKSIKIIC